MKLFNIGSIDQCKDQRRLHHNKGYAVKSRGFISADKLAQRSGFGEERFEKLEFQQKVEQAFGKFKENGISHSDFLDESYSPDEPNRWVNINLGEETIEEVQETIKSIIEKYEGNFSQNIDPELINSGLFK